MKRKAFEIGPNASRKLQVECPNGGVAVGALDQDRDFAPVD